MEAKKTQLLEYATPQRSMRRAIFTQVAGRIFSVIALGLGFLFILHGISWMERSASEQTTADRLGYRESGERFFLCSIVLIVPGIWYGRAAFRPLPAAQRESPVDAADSTNP